MTDSCRSFDAKSTIEGGVSLRNIIKKIKKREGFILAEEFGLVKNFASLEVSSFSLVISFSSLSTFPVRDFPLVNVYDDVEEARPDAGNPTFLQSFLS